MYGLRSQNEEMSRRVQRNAAYRVYDVYRNRHMAGIRAFVFSVHFDGVAHCNSRDIAVFEVRRPWQREGRQPQHSCVVRVAILCNHPDIGLDLCT